MSNYSTYVGLDVHKTKIVIAVAEEVGKSIAVRESIDNDMDSLLAVLRRLKKPFEEILVCYEAGPCGYTIYRYLRQKGISCMVIAPSLIPRKAGDKVKTDGKDAVALARLLKAGQLTPCWVPTQEDEGLRDLVRAREDAKQIEKMAKQQLLSFLDRYNLRPPVVCKPWSTAFMNWLSPLELKNSSQQAALEHYRAFLTISQEQIKSIESRMKDEAERNQRWEVIHSVTALKGIDIINAITIVSEVGLFSRFDTPTKLMAYAGVVPSEYSSGRSTHRGKITKTGNAHLRWAITESAWSYTRGGIKIGKQIQKRREGLPIEVIATADKAILRLHRRFFRLISRGKQSTTAVTAISRELLGFIWAIAVRVEREKGLNVAVA